MNFANFLQQLYRFGVRYLGVLDVLMKLWQLMNWLWVVSGGDLVEIQVLALATKQFEAPHLLATRTFTIFMLVLDVCQQVFLLCLR